jgi:hypothetical protein
VRLAMAISSEKFWQPGGSKSRVFKWQKQRRIWDIYRTIFVQKGAGNGADLAKESGEFGSVRLCEDDSQAGGWR